MSAFSTQFNEHYHSTKDGALFESYHKHIESIKDLLASKASITLLDICFGLGYNTLCALHYLASVHEKIAIYSPELDKSLLEKLPMQRYPNMLQQEVTILKQLITTGHVTFKGCEIELFVGDARAYILALHARGVSFDAVMHDAFSMQVNPTLWTLEYFAQLRLIMADDAILTTYSTALKARLALDECGFFLYEHSHEKMRLSTVASLKRLDASKPYKLVDMAHKRACNPEVRPLVDAKTSSL